mmetsp:Transcript_81274/g.225833  ORF Transcript_81274/g.225833 Transcript_81274/m.225833 type:complete len:248 (-) Transcript_81274:249-992(-)
MPGPLTRALGCALPMAVLLGVAPPASGGPADTALLDDECHAASDGGCALNALQRRAAVAQHHYEFDLARDPENITIVSAQKGASSCSFVPYSGPESGAESCFCHKGGNAACVDKPCSCREGCSNHHGGASSTFRNLAPTNCPGAYLTIPRAYVKDLGDARRQCGAGLQGMLRGMLQAGFSAYQRLQAGSVMQCIHLSGHVSVQWLHLHTFCTGGSVDGMPNSATAVCEEMASMSDADRIASSMASFR